MVCDRCIMVVRQQLDDAGIGYKQVQLGEVELAQQISPQQLDALKTRLSNLGFEVLDDRKSAIINKVKSTIIRIIHTNEAADMNMKLSVLLSEKLDMDYHYLSNLFSSTEGVTIEKYAIRQKIERVKELLSYKELSLSEIADQMEYSSVQHLSQQFKKETGLTPSQFREGKDNT